MIMLEIWGLILLRILWNLEIKGREENEYGFTFAMLLIRVLTIFGWLFLIWDITKLIL
jgi:hypothetical protein